MLKRFKENNPFNDLQSVVTLSDILELQEQSKKIHIHDEVEEYLLDIVEATRNHDLVEIGVSPRIFSFYESGSSKSFIKRKRLCNS